MSLHINFETLSEAGRKGRGLQYLMEDIGLKFGYKVELGGGGADEGRDLFFQYNLTDEFGMSFPQKILVDCKDNSTSKKDVTVDQVGNYVVRIGQHGCTGFLLVTTTDITDDLFRNIRDNAQKQQFSFQVLRGTQLEALLINNTDKFKLTLARFFPAFATKIFEGDNVALAFMFRALESLDHDESIELIAEMLSETTDSLLIWQAITQAAHTLDCTMSDLAALLSAVGSYSDPQIKKAIADSISDLVQQWAEDNFEDSGFYEELICTFSHAEMASFSGVEIKDFEIDRGVVTLNMGGKVNATAFWDNERDDNGFDVSLPCSFDIEIEHGEADFKNVEIDTAEFFGHQQDDTN